MRRKLLLAGTLAVALWAMSLPAAAIIPIPHTPCAAQAAGKAPELHRRYWATRGWYLGIGWHNALKQGCWRDI